MNKKFFFIKVFIILAISLFAQTRNPGTPLRGTWDFQMKEIWKSEQAGDDVFGEIRSLNAAKDGRVYILDSKNFKIYIFSKEGKYISHFGKQGEGPGEIRNLRMGAQLFVTKTSVIVTERGRINYFSLNGTYKKTVTFPSHLTPRAFVSDDIFISAPLISPDRRNQTKKIILYNIVDQVEKVISEYKTFEKAADRQESGGRRMVVGIIIGNITPLMVVNFRDGKVYFGMSDSYGISVANLATNKKHSFYVEGRKQKQVSKQFLQNLKKRFTNIPKEMVQNIINGLPKKASFFQALSIDSNGLIYVYISDPGNDSGRIIDIFSPEGKFLYSAELRVEKDLSIRRTYLNDNVLLMALEDEEGEIRIAKYSINMPPL